MMNPMVRELQNAEWSRVYGPTNSLAGQMVQAERNLARQQQDADRRSAIVANRSASIGAGAEMTGGEIAMIFIVTGPFLWVLVAGAVSAALMAISVPEGLSREIGRWVLPSVTVGLPMAYIIWRGVSALQRLRARIGLLPV